jgi:hypothetical protein
MVYATAALFGVWFLLTILIQFPNPIGKTCAIYDVFAIVPSWTFFAPNPALVDYHIVYRCRLSTGNCTAFKEVRSCKHQRRLIDGAWNPNRRYIKAMHDLISELVALSRELTESEIKFSTPYLTLANFILASSVEQHTQSCQFAIIVSYGFASSEEPSLLFLSEFHSVGLIT